MKIKISILTIFCMIFIQVLTISAYSDIIGKTTKDGNTLYVGGTGPGNYTAIQDAIDDAIDGDFLKV